MKPLLVGVRIGRLRGRTPTVPHAACGNVVEEYALPSMIDAANWETHPTYPVCPSVFDACISGGPRQLVVGVLP